jgi:hypothetical protein
MGAALLVAKFGPTENRANDVVEIVSVATGALTDALEFLRLKQLAFEKSEFGDVFGDTFAG